MPLFIHILLLGARHAMSCPLQLVSFAIHKLVDQYAKVITDFSCVIKCVVCFAAAWERYIRKSTPIMEFDIAFVYICQYVRLYRQRHIMSLLQLHGMIELLDILCLSLMYCRTW